MPTPTDPDLPFFNVGDPLSAAQFNRLVGAIRRQRVTTTAPLETRVGPGGTQLRWAQPRTAAYAVTTSEVTAMEGAVLGVGTIQLYYRMPGGSGTTLAALNPTTAIPVYNITKSTIASGVYVVVVWVDGGWNIDVADCSAGS
jgi:hypothetical protein